METECTIMDTTQFMSKGTLVFRKSVLGLYSVSQVVCMYARVCENWFLKSLIVLFYFLVGWLIWLGFIDALILGNQDIH